MQKIVVFYHADCVDGFMSAFVAWEQYRDEATYIPFQYGATKVDPAVVKDALVYILDVSLSKDQLKVIQEESHSFIWLDHHDSSIEMMCQEETSLLFRNDDKRYILLDKTKCGAILTWEHFNDQMEIPLALRLVDAYDRFDEGRWAAEFTWETAHAFQKAFWLHAPWSFESWDDELYSRHPAPVDYIENRHDIISVLLSEGTVLLREHNNQVARVAAQARDGYLCNGIAMLIANSQPNLASSVGHALAKKAGVGLTWYTTDGETARCSIRGNGRVDVSKIAAYYGGGGHKNASGFSVPIVELMGFYSR